MQHKYFTKCLNLAPKKSKNTNFPNFEWEVKIENWNSLMLYILLEVSGGIYFVTKDKILVSKEFDNLLSKVKWIKKVCIYI